MTGYLILFVGVSALLILLGLPLSRGRVPPNFLYGYRTNRTMKDPDEWYRVNRRTGVLFVAVGGVSLATAVILYFTADISPQLYSNIYSAVVVGGLLIAALVAPRRSGENHGEAA